MRQFRRITTPRDGLESLWKAADRPLRPTRAGKMALVAAGGLVLAIAGWALATLFVEQLRFAVLAPRAQAGVEAAAVSARLFGALVLGLFFVERSGERLRWVAGGLLVLGLGSLRFGYLEATFGGIPDLNAAAY